MQEIKEIKKITLFTTLMLKAMWLLGEVRRRSNAEVWV